MLVGSSRNIFKRWKDYKTRLHNGEQKNPHFQASWIKHGESAFEFLILEEYQFDDSLPLEVNQKVLLLLEDKWMDICQSRDPKFGYNFKGASCPTLSLETRKRISESQKGRVTSETTRLKLSEACRGEKHYLFGKHLSKITRQKLSEAKKGKKLSEEHKRKISESTKGILKSEEHKQKLSETHKGEKCYAFGKHPSEETRLKMSEAHKRENLSEATRLKKSKASKGNKNPNFGKHPSEVTRIKLSESHRGKTLSKEQKLKISEGMKRFFASKRAATPFPDAASSAAI